MLNDNLATRLDALLPQTQCTRCGYPACRPYAEAIALGAADIDQCPPGGQAGVDALARLLGRDSKPLNETFGRETPPTVAVIDEDVCIGCTKCIQACPVDAIVGAGKRMHTIIAAECTGCELCIAPCPVDCISMQATSPRVLDRPEVIRRAAHTRRRYEARAQRLSQERRALAARRGGTTSIELKHEPISRQAVLDAIARGLARRAARRPDSSTE